MVFLILQICFVLPPTKEDFKKLIKQKVIAYWEVTLRDEADKLKSLCYFKPDFMSLMVPHRLWTSAGYSPYNVAKATVQATMLSGRYRCGALERHWGKGDGYCTLSESCAESMDDVRHILQGCSALHAVREMLVLFTSSYSTNLSPLLRDLLVQSCSPSNPELCDFLLDCSALPTVISMAQCLGQDIYLHLFNVTRTWVYALHRERLKLKGEWKSNSV